MTDPDLIIRITAELKTARQSQSDGNPGRARVCARRAAGWAIQEYLAQQGQPLNSPSALDHLKYLSGLPDFSDQIYRALHRLTIKMEKDSHEEEAYYPIEGVDLVTEAVFLIEGLLRIKLDLL